MTSFCPKEAKHLRPNIHPLRRAGMPNSTVAVNEPHDVATGVKSRSTDVPMIDLESIINEEDERIHELILAKEISDPG